MSSLYRLSKWARLHDWDWVNAPIIPGQEDFVRMRATVLPSRFFYHVLRVAKQLPGGADGSPGEQQVSLVPYHPLVHRIRGCT